MNSPVITKSKGKGKLSSTLLNFFLPNLEKALTLWWFNFNHFFIYVFASWKHYSTCVIYERVELGSRTPLTFFSSIQRTKCNFSPAWQILFDTTSPPFNINSYKRLTPLLNTAGEKCPEDKEEALYQIQLLAHKERIQLPLSYSFIN